MAAKISTKI